MAESFNPFEHHHDHHHDHEDDATLRQQLDPAQQSLADALQVSFNLLKWVMVLLVVIYAFSGIFTVGSDEMAVRLQFGAIVTVDEQNNEKVLTEGGPYFAFPYPIEQVVRVPRAVQQIDLDEEFWFKVTGQQGTQTEDELAGTMTALNPEQDGSLLTGDANIAHARWSISYRIQDPVAFITNIGDPSSEQSIIAAANRTVRAVAAQGVVYAVARLEAERLQKGLRESDTQMALKRMQEALDTLNSGIEIQTVSAKRTIFPLSVRDAFRAVIEAESEKAQAIEEAQQERARILGETAGEANEALLRLVEDYELASESGDQARLKELEAKFDQAFDTLVVPSQSGRPATIGGKVAQVINEARTYRTQVVAEIRGKADYLETLLPQYEKNPAIVRNDLWQKAIRNILGSPNVEQFYTPAQGQLYLELSRDPLVTQEREARQIERVEQERRRRAEEDQANQGASGR